VERSVVILLAFLIFANASACGLPCQQISETSSVGKSSLVSERPNALEASRRDWSVKSPDFERIELRRFESEMLDLLEFDEVDELDDVGLDAGAAQSTLRLKVCPPADALGYAAERPWLRPRLQVTSVSTGMPRGPPRSLS
jgi:hypothetical protein